MFRINRTLSLIPLPMKMVVVAVLLCSLSGLLFVAGRADAAAPYDSLIKAAGPNAAVYYLSSAGTRYVFPNEKTYYSWFTDFSDVYEVSMDELVSYPLGGNVTFRPGIYLVKIRTNPKVYAVAPGGILRWIASENVARGLYGSDWNKKVKDVPDAFFVNYVIGDPIYEYTEYDPVGAANASTTIGADKGLSVGPGAHQGDTAPDVGDAAQIRESGTGACQADTWSCSSWTSCPAGLQTRSCIKSYDCPGVDTPSPTTAQSCTADGESCTEDTWTCGSWSECSGQGLQTRSCTMTHDCPQYTTASPATSQACTPVSGPFVHVEITDSVSSSTVSPGADYVPMLGFSVRPDGTDLRLATIAAFGYVDADNDGVFAKSEEDGVAFGDIVDECAVFEGDTNLGVFQSVGETQSGEAMAAVGLYSFNYNISDGETANLTMKCNILESAGNHGVALVFEAQEPFGAVQGIASEIALFTTEYMSSHPMNGNGVDSADVVITVEGEAEEDVLPVVSLISLPTSVLTAGQTTAMRFMIAAPGDRVAVRHLTFEATLETGSSVEVSLTSESSVREVGSPSNIAGGARINGGSDCISDGSATTCTIEVGFDENLIIPASGMRTFDLSLDILGSVSSGDVLSARLLRDETAREGRLIGYVGGYSYSAGSGSDNLVWYDMEGLPSDQTTISDMDYHWRNGAGILHLPSDLQVLSR